MEIDDDILERDYTPLNEPCETTLIHTKRPYHCTPEAQIIINNTTPETQLVSQSTFTNSKLYFNFYEIETLATTIVSDYTLIRTAGVYKESNKGAVLQDYSNRLYYVHLVFEKFCDIINGSIIEINGSVMNYGKTVTVMSHQKMDVEELSQYVFMYKNAARYASIK